MSDKQGQVTYFILFGFIIAIAVSLIFYIKGINISKLEPSIESDVSYQSAVSNFMVNCIKDSVKASVKILALSGGYYSKPKFYINFSLFSVPYYLIYGQGNYPSKKTLENQMKTSIEASVGYCADKLNVFKEQGLSFEFNAPSASTNIANEKVVVNLDYPIKVNVPFNKSFHLKNFRYDLENRIGLLHEISTKLIEEQLTNGKICLNCMSEIAETNNLTIQMYRYDNSFVFIIEDNLSKIENEPLVFIFATKHGQYSCKNLPLDDLEFISECANLELEKKGYPLSMKDIPKQVGNVNSDFYYKVESSGFNVSYYDYSSLFDINQKNGIIQFTPTEKHKGTHNVWVSAKDGFGDIEYKNFELKIV